MLYKICNRGTYDGLEVHLYLSQGDDSSSSNFRRFNTDSSIFYEPFCDDFGPMSFACLVRFFAIIEAEIRESIAVNCRDLVYCSGEGARAFTNCAFLIGAYLLLKHGVSLDDLNDSFSQVTSMAVDNCQLPRFEHDFSSPGFPSKKLGPASARQNPRTLNF